MGSLLRRFVWLVNKMFKLFFVIAMGAAAPLEDTAEVAAAKAEFQAAFDDAAAGGLAAKQEPAPVHVVAAPKPLAVAAPVPVAPLVHTLPVGLPYGLHYGAYPYGLVNTALPYGLPAFGLHGLPYNGLPIITTAAAE